MSLPYKLGIVCLFRDGTKTMFMDYRNHPHPIHEGFYSPPGGKFDSKKGDITLEDTARREPKEEAGIIPRKLEYRGTVYFKNEKRTVKGQPMKYNFKVLYYDCHDFDASNAEATEGKLEWIDNDRVLEKEMHEGDKAIWEWLLKYKEFDGIIVQNGMKLESAELLYHVPLN